MFDWAHKLIELNTRLPRTASLSAHRTSPMAWMLHHLSKVRFWDALTG
jgi:hypothetical protein